MFWSKGVGNWLTTSIISEQNHKLFRSILWSSFRNHKSVQNIMRGKSPSSSTPCHFVASTLRSILRESLRNLGQCSTHRPHMYPTPGRAWGMGVVRGCARAVPARPPPPWLHSYTIWLLYRPGGTHRPPPFVSISRLLRHSSLRQSYFEKKTT